MKKLILILFILIISIFSIIAQSPCPTISVTNPKGVTRYGESMSFTAKIEGINLESLKLNWTVSNGEIISGQGTLKIDVATTDDMAGMTITATVEISGSPQNCPNAFSGSGDIEEKLPFGSPLKFDEYEKISWYLEKVKLDNVAKGLQENEETVVIFRIAIAAKNSSQMFKAKLNKIEKYLTGKHKISNGRIKIVFGGSEENRTEIYILPIGVTPL